MEVLEVMKRRMIVAGVIVSLIFFSLSAMALSTSKDIALTNKTIAKVVQNALPSIVAIRVNATKKIDIKPLPPLLPPPFDELFKNLPKETPVRALGTGVVISKDGYIVTHCHVIKDAEEGNIIVEFRDGTTYSGDDVKIIGKDKSSDIAVLKVPRKNCKYLSFADSDKLEVGEFVIALGNPLGELYSATFGIVSAKGRQLGNFGAFRVEFQDFIQTDAAINPGNSGGPLLNLEGKVVGINDMITTTNGGNIGIGYAISSNIAKDVVKQLIKYGSVKRGWLGVYIRDIDKDIQDFYNVEKGVLITEVIPDSPAEKANMQRDEVIIEYDGHKIKNTKELIYYVSHTKIGKEVKIKVIDKKGKEKIYKVKIGKRPEEENLLLSENTKKILGLTLQNLTPDLKEQLGLDKDLKGVLVTDVDVNSDAYFKGIRKNDVIIEVNRTEVNSVDDVRKALKKSKGKKVLIVVRRKDTNIYIVINKK